MDRVSLQKISTRELLRALKGLHVYDKSEPEDPLKKDGSFKRRQYIASRMTKGGNHGVCMATEAELIAELNTRPHIPGRTEGKILRRLMAQTGWTAEQLYAHPKFGQELADAHWPHRRVITDARRAKELSLIHGSYFKRLFKVVL